MASKDNQAIAFYSMYGRFAHDDAAAHLANTRTMVFGTDNVASVLEAANTWPGTPDLDTLEMLREYATADAPQHAQAQQDANDNPVDVQKAREDLKKIGIDTSEMTDSEVVTRARAEFQKLYDKVSSALLTHFDWQTYLKQAGFILLALILIYVGVKAAT